MMKSYPGLPALGCFIQTWYHVMFIPVDDLPLSTIVLAGNDRIALLKASSTRILSKLEDACLFCSKECVKEL